MAFEKFLIAPMSDGLQNDARPWMISDVAFEKMQNCYNFRGRIRKRFGSRVMNTTVDQSLQQFYTRFRLDVGANTDSSGDTSGAAPGQSFHIGQMFAVKTGTSPESWTSFQVISNTPGAQPMLRSDGSVAAATFDVSTGDFVIDAVLTPGVSPVPVVGATVWFYPSDPVMGLLTYENGPLPTQPTYGFDPQFVYTFVNGGWQGLDLADWTIWTGTDAQFIWGTTWRGTKDSDDIFFVTNFHYTSSPNTTDPIQYYDGTQWSIFAPVWDPADDNQVVVSCLAIVRFKNRLLLISPVLGDLTAHTTTLYANGIIFSKNGSPIDVDAFLSQPGGGGFSFASTKQQIKSAQFIKDRLIIFFEASTYELVYTNNQIQPFVWQQINVELGVDSTFSIVPFDKVVVAIGNTGIMACNGANVERIDQKIPNTVRDIHIESDGPFRVYGIRDYYVETVYWTMPGINLNTFSVFPNRILVYNYRTGSWAFNDDSITAFGYFSANPADTASDSGITWANTDYTWQEMDAIWASDTDESGSLQSPLRWVMAGNQQGWTFIINPDLKVNSDCLSITQMTLTPLIVPTMSMVTITSVNHNLTINDYVHIENVLGITGFNGNYPISSVTSADTFTIVASNLVAAPHYLGGGTISRVSRIDIYTKQYNFFTKDGKNTLINKIDFNIDRTQNGQFDVDILPSSSNYVVQTLTVESSAYASIPFESQQSQIWHPIYPLAEGEMVQLNIYYSNDQMKDPDITSSNFTLHAMQFYASPTSRLQ